MNKIAGAVAAAVSLALAACDNPLDTSTPEETGNPRVRAERIAEVDGCVVYYVVARRDFYFVRCPLGDRASTHWTTAGLAGRVPATDHHSVEVMP